MKMSFSGGRPETECGAGSTLANTTNIRAWLPGLLRCLEVRWLLDAPCGDFNWMAHADLSGIDYLGADYDPEHIERSWSRSSYPAAFAPLTRGFVNIDIVAGQLPPADVMLCRDFLQHLPNAVINIMLLNFLASKIRWLLATSYSNAENVDIAAEGSFRPLNLLAPPFQFLPPHRWAADQPGSGRVLGLWSRCDVERAMSNDRSGK